MPTLTETVPPWPLTLPDTDASVAIIEFPTPEGPAEFMASLPGARPYRYHINERVNTLSIVWSTYSVYDLDAAARARCGGAVLVAAPA